MAQGSRRSGSKWAALAAQKLIMIGFHMWEHRNSIKHSDDSLENKRLAQVTDVGIKRQFTLGSTSLPRVARLQLQQPRSKVLELELAQRIRWLNWMQREREVVERQFRARRKMMYEFTHSVAPPTRSKRRVQTRRVFSTVKKPNRRMFQQRLVFDQ